jgi:cell division protein FtsI/penicillin-binding protein 2
VEALVAQIYRNDELHGTSGVEGLCDSALRGVNGFVEDIGLQEREDSARASLYKQKLDGHAVQLTLDLELQKAAQETIEHPKLPSGESWRDEVWFRNPVGAIVLATVDGEILAAASGPKEPHELEEALSIRDGERQFAYDRCFRRPRFQPVGSIFKPFVAAYALDRLGLTPETVLACEVRDGFGSAGWDKVSCNSRWGHHDVTLVPALEQSCNAYFAQVGEFYGERAPFLEMAHMFGFDRPTGVRDAWDGRGFVEDTRIPRFVTEREFLLQELHKGCNGLELLEATPVQVARAAAGLATGRLPAMRLVRAIGGELVPASYEEVPISERSLSVVRGALRGVISRGSASGKGLESELLGFDLAGKTGSADYLPMSNSYRAQLNTPSGRSPEMRKHTWFMGYFPAEAPRYVVVAYLHDIGVTSSHSAVYVAGQFLKSPAVQDLVREGMR